MADKNKTPSSATERRGSSAIDRNIGSNAEAVAAGMSVAAGSLILGAVLPHRADAKNQADPLVRTTDPHQDAASHLVPQGDGAPPHAGQAAAAPAANVVPPDPAHATDQSARPSPDASLVQHTDGQTSAEAFASSAAPATVTDISHSAAGDAHYAATTADQSTTISASETAPQWHMDGIDPAVTLLGRITATVQDATAAISNSLAGTADHLMTTVGNLTHTISETFGGQLPSSGTDSLLQNVDDVTSSLGDTIHSVAAPLLAPSAAPDALTPDLVAGAHTTPLDTAVDVSPTTMALGEDFQTIHIGFIGQSMANTIDATDISTHALGSILHGYV